MSLRSRLISLKANRNKWENVLAAAVAACFAGAVLCNVGLFFSVRRTPSLLGAAFSRLYVVSWFLGAVFLRDRARWVRAVCAVRWTAAGAILLGIAAGAGGGMGWFSALCVMPYALFTSAYSGLSLGAWATYLLPLVQAVTAALLLRRLGRRRADRQK